MKIRYKISIIVAVVSMVLFLVIPVMSTPIICEDKILYQDDCWSYLDGKYKTIPVVSYFLKISDYKGLGMTVENFQAKTLSVSSIEGKLISHMEIDTATSTIIYKCMALENGEDIFVNIENPTIDDIDNNRCSSFDTEHLKSRDELRCEQIGGNPNHLEYDGCVLQPIVCDDSSDFFTNEKECLTNYELCKDLGGNIVESLSCRDSVRAEYEQLGKPAPCDFRGPAGCEFPK